MKYILDTHYVLWTLFEPQKIDRKIVNILKNPAFPKFVSGISFWEISLKYSLGKLELTGTNPDEVFVAIKASGVEILEADSQTMSSFYKLPKKEAHKDPFDRLIAWQSIVHDFILITKDKSMTSYIADGLQLAMGK